MYINAVLSYLGAWEKLRTKYSSEFEDISQVIKQSNVTMKGEVRERLGGHATYKEPTYSPIELNKALVGGFKNAGWEVDTGILLGKGSTRRTIAVDSIKNSVGVEISFGKYPFVESDLFVKFPIFLRAGKVKIACVVMATESLAQSMPTGVSKFETVRDRLTELYPLPLKYPFVVVGLSDQFTEIQVIEMTAEIDRYLV